MSHPRFVLAPLASALMLALSSPLAYAQAAADVPTTTLTPVTVEASADASAEGLAPPAPGGQVAKGGRVGLFGQMNVMDTPFSTTSYTQKLIQDQQARSVADVLQNDPGVRMTRGYGNYQEAYNIRGLPVYSDDVSYNGLYGLLPRQFIAIELMERVEVFRGANTFLNGAAPAGSGIGGAINLMPKRAPNEPLTQVSFGVESGSQFYAAADVARRFGTDQALGIRLNAVRRDGGTSVDDEKRKLSDVSLGLDYRGSNYRLSADVGYQQHKLRHTQPSLQLGSGVLVPDAPKASRNFGQDWEYSNERDTFGTVRGEYDINDNITAWAAAGARKGDEAYDSGSPLTLANNNGTLTGNRLLGVRKDEVATGELGLRGKFQTGPIGHTVVATGSTYHLDSKNAYRFYFGSVGNNLYNPVSQPAPTAGLLAGGGSLTDPLTTHRVIVNSLALADTLAFAEDKVKLTLGVRRQSIKDDSYDYVSGASNATYDRSRVTPVAGLVVKPMDRVSLYANYIEALVQGASVVNNGLTTSFAPYVSRQKEIGAKYDGERVGGTLSLFTLNRALARVTNNLPDAGEQRNRGVELSVFGAPMRGVRVLGGATLLDTKQTRAVNAANNGNEGIGSPKYLMNAGAEWDVPGIEGLTLTGRLVYTASQYVDDANTQKIAPWTRVDVGARYLTTIGSKLVTFRARIDNLANRNYWASSSDALGLGSITLGAPRTFSLTATIDF